MPCWSNVNYFDSDLQKSIQRRKKLESCILLLLLYAVEEKVQKMRLLWL